MVGIVNFMNVDLRVSLRRQKDISNHFGESLVEVGEVRIWP